MTRTRALGGALDTGVGALLFSLVVLPVPALVAGFVFARDRFYHWDHFVVAPALAHQHGMALALDVYAPYGLGWPTLMSSLSSVLPLSHQNVIAFAAVFHGLYVVATFVLFRALVKGRGLALAGTLFALWLGFFTPVFAELPGLRTNWQWPSILSLRAPFDALFFLGLLLHARSGRPAGALLAAGCAGLGLFFETDTGLMLIGVLGVYWACTLLFGFGRGADGADAGTPPAGAGRALLMSAGVFMLSIAAGLAFATHGRIVSEPGGVLAGWLGGLTTAVSVSARLFNRFVAEEASHVPVALALVGTCLFAVGGTALRALHRRLDPTSLLLGCVGLYGAGRLVLFVWNTEAIRLKVAALPVAVIVTVALAHAIEGLAPRARRIASAAALVAAAALLFASPTFRSYPNIWNVSRTGLPTEGRFLIPARREIWVERPQDRRLARPLNAAVSKVRSLAEQGEPVAVIDPFKTFVFLEAGVRPWTGDSALFMNTWTHEASGALIDRFLATGPRYVLIRRQPPSSRLILDTWTKFRESLRPRYRVVEELPIFDLLYCDTCEPPR